jgi:hypothetical protein
LVQLGNRLGEIGIDRVELLNRCDMGDVGLPDQRAFGHQRSPDPAVDRRADRGVIEIELCARDIGIAGGNVSLCLTQAGDRELELRLRNRARGRQRLRALGVLRLLVEHGAGLGKRGFSGSQFNLEWRGIEPIKHLAGLDLASLLEIAADDNS